MAGKVFTHGAYDADAASRLFSDDGFVEAVSTALGILGVLFVESPRSETGQRGLVALRSIDFAADWPFGEEADKAQVGQMLAQGAAEESEEGLQRAFTRLFRGPASLPAPPWGSVYMDRDKVLNGWTWVELRTWMRANGIAGAYEANDPEDGFGRLLSLAAELANARQSRLFCELLADHLLPWAPRFLELFGEGARKEAGSLTYEAVGLAAAATLDDLRSLLDIVPAVRKIYR